MWADKPLPLSEGTNIMAAEIQEGEKRRPEVAEGFFSRIGKHNFSEIHGWETVKLSVGRCRSGIPIPKQQEFPLPFQSLPPSHIVTFQKVDNLLKGGAG